MPRSCGAGFEGAVVDGTCRGDLPYYLYQIPLYTQKSELKLDSVVRPGRHTNTHIHAHVWTEKVKGNIFKTEAFKVEVHAAKAGEETHSYHGFSLYIQPCLQPSVMITEDLARSLRHTRTCPSIFLLEIPAEVAKPSYAQVRGARPRLSLSKRGISGPTHVFSSKERTLLLQSVAPHHPLLDISPIPSAVGKLGFALWAGDLPQVPSSIQTEVQCL